MQDVDVLGGVRDAATQRVARDVPQVDAAHESPAPVGLVEAGEQPAERALPGPGRADQADRLPAATANVAPVRTTFGDGSAGVPGDPVNGEASSR